VPTGGVRRYTSELATALALEFPQDQYWLLSDQPIPDQGALPANLDCGAGPQSALQRKWWLWGIQREMSRHGCEVFHGTDFSVPYLKRYPSVMTLHDLSPWRAEPWQPDAARVRRRTPFLLKLGMATMVITPSEAVRVEAIRRFNLDASRVVAVPLAPSPTLPRAPARKWPRPYFLFVGTLEPRKNIARLIEAWREVRKDREIDLVLAGRVRSDFKSPEPEPGLHLPGPVPEEDLGSWYFSAAAFVYPSLYEGFGLPVLEAMQCGSVVITSRDPAVMEVTGGAAIHVRAQDTRALAAAMAEVVADRSKFTELRVRAFARAGEFSWKRTARKTRQVYREAQNRFR
jgi:glycosyltransferase involved in cell wall biosynthesis